jgi:hypothetical protein
MTTPQKIESRDHDVRLEFNALLKKVEAAKRSAGVDLSTDEDLSVGVMNLLSIEEHFFFTGAKTEKPEYFDLLNDVRQVRKAMLERLVPKEMHEGETWCIAKHLLAATMRLIEVGTKLQQDGKKSSAAQVFGYAYRLYTLFWGLRFKLIDTRGMRKTAAQERAWSLKDIVDKLVDCCDE